jgi:hypothetical protein
MAQEGFILMENTPSSSEVCWGQDLALEADKIKGFRSIAAPL